MSPGIDETFLNESKLCSNCHHISCWLLLRYISWLVKVILSTMHFKMQLWHHTNIMMCDLIFGEWSGEILISNCSLHWMGIPYMFTALVHLQWFNSFSVQHLKILGYLFLNLHDIMRKGSPSGIFLSRRRLSIWSKKWNPMCHNIVIDGFLAFSYIYMWIFWILDIDSWYIYLIIFQILGEITISDILQNGGKYKRSVQ